MANILVLGGTQWLGRTLVRYALSRGHAVSALARGISGDFPSGAEALVADRDGPDAYDVAAARDWDLVVDLTRFPAHAAGALDALSARAKRWVFISSSSVYADTSRPGGTEGAQLLPPLNPADGYTPALYGEAKSGCEKLLIDARGGAALILRPGLVGGPGDPSDRTTYWPLRLADPHDPVLLPVDDGDHRQHVQIIDVRDLAAFAVDAGLEGREGAVNSVGESTVLVAALNAASTAAGRQHDLVPFPISRMALDGVPAWNGPGSFPWVLPPGEEHAGFARRSDARALELGLARRPLTDTFRDIIAAGPPWVGRQLGAGLSRADEVELLGHIRAPEEDLR